MLLTDTFVSSQNVCIFVCINIAKINSTRKAMMALLIWVYFPTLNKMLNQMYIQSEIMQ